MLPAYKTAAAQNDYVFSIVANGAQIGELIDDVSCNNERFDTMCSQVKTYSGNYEGTPQIKILPTGFEMEVDPRFSCFASDKFLSKLTFQQDTSAAADMQRRPFDCIPNKAATHKLNL